MTVNIILLSSFYRENAHYLSIFLPILLFLLIRDLNSPPDEDIKENNF